MAGHRERSHPVITRVDDPDFDDKIQTAIHNIPYESKCDRSWLNFLKINRSVNINSRLGNVVIALVLIIYLDNF
ncbi:MAG: hypothetical protein F6K31_00260 [Symploca sp. SIO2G7]|nr:hypothetical protein [Symploca sp. SIO2G7]